jgi:voltage-gated potassium channel
MIQFLRKQLIEKLTRKVSSVSNLILLILVFIFIFCLSLLPESIYPVVQRVVFSLIFFTSVYALETGRKKMMMFAIIAFITEWLSGVINMPVLHYISFGANILFFQFIVIKLIIQISRRKEVDAGVIMESINGYLMMGMLFTTLVLIIMGYNPAAFSFGEGTLTSVTREAIYFTFITMTSTGFGDVLPQIPVAKSLAILMSTAGQIYIAVIISMLVGKFASQSNTKH